MIHKVSSDYTARITIPGAGEVERRLQVTPEIALWEYLYFRTYTYRTGMVIDGESAGEEMVMVLLSGRVIMEVESQRWALDGRSSVFEGAPHIIYLPPGRSYRMTVLADSDCAYSRAPADGRLPPRWIRPQELTVETVGQGPTAHQVTRLLNPGDAEKLIAQELLTPPGGWADWPAHRHLDVQGGPVNAVHYTRFQDPRGWALQHLTQPDGSLQETLFVNHGDAVLVRQSAHPVVSCPASAMYTLNFLASAHPTWQVEALPVVVPEHP